VPTDHEFNDYGTMQARALRQVAAAGSVPPALVGPTPRTLRQIVATHRAVALASSAEIRDLVAELTEHIRRGHFGLPDEPAARAAVDKVSAAVIEDIRRQRDSAQGQDRLFGSSAGKLADLRQGIGQREAQWIKANPGLVALLEIAEANRD
jgi:hypothetical protein